MNIADACWDVPTPPHHRRPKERQLRIENVEAAFVGLRAEGVMVDWFEPEDIVDCVPDSTLNLCWLIIAQSHLQRNLPTPPPLTDLSSLTNSLAGQLVAWLRRRINRYEDVNVIDLGQESFGSGMALCALADCLAPNRVKMELLQPGASRHNLERAFHVADKYLNVSPLMELDDFDPPGPDDACIMTYVGEFLSIYRERNGMPGAAPAPAAAAAAKKEKVISPRAARAPRASAADELKAHRSPLGAPKAAKASSPITIPDSKSSKTSSSSAHSSSNDLEATSSPPPLLQTSSTPEGYDIVSSPPVKQHRAKLPSSETAKHGLRERHLRRSGERQLQANGAPHQSPSSTPTSPTKSRRDRLLQHKAASSRSSSDRVPNHLLDQRRSMVSINSSSSSSNLHQTLQTTSSTSSISVSTQSPKSPKKKSSAAKLLRRFGSGRRSRRNSSSDLELSTSSSSHGRDTLEGGTSVWTEGSMRCQTCGAPVAVVAGEPLVCRGCGSVLSAAASRPTAADAAEASFVESPLLSDQQLSKADKLDAELYGLTSTSSNRSVVGRGMGRSEEEDSADDTDAQIDRVRAKLSSTPSSDVLSIKNNDSTTVVEDAAARDEEWSIPFKELKLDRELGRGAFGVVYAGVWRLQEVAVKQLIGEKAASGPRYQELLAECRLMMSLRPHRNVVQLLGVSASPGRPLCVVTALAPGGSLRDLLDDRTRSLTWQLVVQLLCGIGAGVYHLHMEAVLHRDLAARNVLLTAAMEPQITDFGLSAKVLDPNAEHKQKEFFRGPYKHMAPESLASNLFSVKSDAWMFGVVAWELFTRLEPHAGIDIYEAARRIRKGATPATLMNTPKAMAKLLNNCWQKDPNDRVPIETSVVTLKSLKPSSFDRYPTWPLKPESHHHSKKTASEGLVHA